jgi:hypothetical protein
MCYLHLGEDMDALITTSLLFMFYAFNLKSKSTSVSNNAHANVRLLMV